MKQTKYLIRISIESITGVKRPNDSVLEFATLGDALMALREATNTASIFECDNIPKENS